MRRWRVVVLGTALVALVAAAVVVTVHRSAAPSATAGRAFPEPGSIAASPGTSITVRGVDSASLKDISAQGSRSGDHAGSVRFSRDGQGATFSPKTPFKSGEEVTVHTAAAVNGAHDGRFSFRIAQLAEAAESTPSADAPTAGPYATAPDLDPPAQHVTASGSALDGLIATAPDEGRAGLLLSDRSGQPVWSAPAAPGHTVGDLHADTYRGRPVLVYFDGVEGFGAGNYRGSWHILNTAYQEVATVSAGNGARADLHDLLLRPDGTAVVESYDPVITDMRKYGGKQRATVLDCDIQQIDVATGDVLFEWHSLDHFSPRESYADLTGSVVDYIHANSLAADPNHPNNVIVSARHLSQVFALNLKTAAVQWRLGGRHPTLRLAHGARDTANVAGTTLPFSFQHDARLQADGTLTVYDNGNQRSDKYSRAATFIIDPAHHLATEDNDAELRHEPELYGEATGNVQTLPDGHTLVSWGTTGKATEYDQDRHVVAELSSSMTYRTFLVSWHATPETRPAVAVEPADDGSLTVRASWNGSTETASWQILAGADPDSLHQVGTADRAGFETAATVAVDGAADYVQVRARAADGAVLGSSIAVRVPRS